MVETVSEATENLSVLDRVYKPRISPMVQERLIAEQLIIDQYTADLSGYAGATSPEGVMMASTETLQTMRAGGTFNIPEGLKTWFPLILIFALVVLVIFKK